MEEVNCNLCNSNNFRIIYPSNLNTDTYPPKENEFRCSSDMYSRHGQIVQCNVCNFIYTNPRDNDKEIVECYSNVVDINHIHEKESRIRTFEKYIKEIERIKKPGKLLDIGCYTGFFLEVALRHRWQVSGIEPSKWAIEYIEKELKLTVQQGIMEELTLPKNEFDVVTMWDVIEHLNNALLVLQRIYETLKPGGLLCITTHDMDSLPARILGEKYPFLLRMHNYHFTRNTLTTMLEKTGFKVAKIVSHRRVVRLGYFFDRVENYGGFVTRIAHKIIKNNNWENKFITFGFSGLITVFAEK